MTPRRPRPHANQTAGVQPANWRERLGVLRTLAQLLGLVWQAQPALTAAMIALRLARGVVPVATLWVGKLIIDAVVSGARGAGVGDLWRYVALEVVIVLGGELLARASSLVESLLGDLFSNFVSIRLMVHSATLDLTQFEDPTTYDHLERARQQTTGRIALLAQLFSMAQDAITLTTLAIVLVAYSPWLLLLLVAAVFPSFLGETHYAALGYSLLFRRTPERRELDYLRFIGASDETAKEVQIFGLAPWLAKRYGVLARRYYQENARLSIRKGAVSAVLSVVSTAGYYAAYVVILRRAVAGLITIGTLTFLAGAFMRSRDLTQRLLLAASDVYAQCLNLRDLFAFFALRPTVVSRAEARPVPTPIRDGFVFENVSFRYAGSDRWAVRHVNLAIRPGERIALVGENGAGKTTITKLLARLYDPTEGRVLLDGTDLRDYDLASLRRAISVVFQDFVRYDLRFDENIGVGGIEIAGAYLESLNATSEPGARRERAATQAADAPTDGVRARIAEAAERSLAASLLPRLPHGYRQMLGRRFEGGVDLSGGEWQKVALARAYMREAQVLILDEPTASLDARAEYEVFLRFGELMAGRTAVLVSHRFSTVRMADRIVVLVGGRVEEEGTHEELVARRGRYAELFDLQAAGYR
jgi:ATP-binding cassette subfamily B protein